MMNKDQSTNPARICEHCGNEYTPRYLGQKYCCPKCYSAHVRLMRHSPRATAVEPEPAEPDVLVEIDGYFLDPEAAMRLALIKAQRMLPARQSIDELY